MSEATTTPGGKTILAGRPVARIGYGVMQLTERHGRAPLVEADAIVLLRRSVELGIRHFDTAQFYGDGRANRFLRVALAPYDDMVIATKVGAVSVDAPVPLAPAQKPRELRASVEANLATLGVDRVGIAYLRRADIRPGIIATGDQIVDLDDQLAELIALRSEGKIGAIGLSSVSLAQLEQALPAGIASVQNSYGVLDRAGEPLLEICRREGIAWTPYFPLGSAFPGYPKVTEQPAVIDAAKSLGATPSQVGLAWLLQHAPNTLLIAGTSSVDHLEENVATDGVTLDPATVAVLDALWSETI